jgi:Undecaprenyl-phosphate glucose phosphotransferase
MSLLSQDRRQVPSDSIASTELASTELASTELGSTELASTELASRASIGSAYPFERRSAVRDKTATNPLLVLLGLQLFDFAAPILIGWVCYQFHDASGPTFWSVCGKFSVVAAALSVLIFRLSGCYRIELILDGPFALRKFLVSFFWLVWLGLIMAFLSKSLSDVSRVWTVLWLLSWAAVAVASRISATRLMTARVAKGDLYESIAVIGATDWASQLCAQLVKQKVPRLRIVGVFDDRQDRVAEPFARTVRTVDELLLLGRRVHIDRVVLALPLEAEARILQLSRRLKALSVNILACPDLRKFELLRRPIVDQAGMPAIRIAARPISDGHFLLKTASDKLVSFALLVMLVPVLLVIAVGIKCSGAGPVLFRQKRHGYNNREFEVLKFRSMRVEGTDASGAHQARRNDSRVSPFGAFLRKTSLDELPQLINVLRGDMSLVGPRPLPIGMRTHDLYNHEIVEEYPHRHRVRPGITGWAQVNGARGATESPQQLQTRVEMDLFYIENWSLLFDVKIMFLTIVHLLRPKNAF